MVSNDDFDGKATNLNYLYLQTNFEQKFLKPAIVARRVVVTLLLFWFEFLWISLYFYESRSLNDFQMIFALLDGRKLSRIKAAFLKINSFI